MKTFKLLSAKLLFLILITSFFACNDEDDPNLTPPLTAQEIFEAKLCKYWEVQSFLENGIERDSELKSLDCYMPIRFKGGNDRIFAGINNTIDCYISGSWGENVALDSMYLNFYYSPFIGIGPYSSDQSCQFEIVKLTGSELKLSGQFNGSDYLITFYPL